MTFISCTSEMSKSEKHEVAANLHIQNNEEYNQLLLNSIRSKIRKSDIKDFKKVKIYDSLSRGYFDYLNNIEHEIKENGNKIFFSGENYSRIGEDFIEKTRNYKSEIEVLLISSDFTRRFNEIFDVADVKTKEGIYIKYLDYHFKGYPNIWSEIHINEMKRKVLELENEFINDMIINSRK